ncbi:uncharacterized protein LOC110033420 isoform X2 [Phalaenopsis equestris]|uniref:uncharacterized protein LOC110033420 isoform X2 n=1 Tax=Phalaenopsis equestris TaxID=78828 RepID=UPI0009E2349E|nr:uncharacterized protein LOC110033420 isoform X2 [Phalaenopsis equestris]
MRLINARSPFGDLSPQIIGPRLKFDVHARVLLPQRNFFAFRLKTDSFGTARSAVQSIFTSFSSVSSGILSLNQSATSFKDFRVYADVGEREIKVRVDVSGARTQEIFDDVFSKLVDAAQPIPGFRRVKGGKTPEEGLNVTKELRVEQSYDEIEAAFIPGEEFSFEAIIGLQQTSKS